MTGKFAADVPQRYVSGIFFQLLIMLAVELTVIGAGDGIHLFV